jgi:cell division protein FtsB
MVEMDSKNNKKRKKRGNTSFKYIVLFVFAFFSAFLVVQSIRSVSLTSQKLEVFDLANSEVDELRLRNLELIIEKELVIGDRYVEVQARDRLNYAKDGETLFVISEFMLEDPVLEEYVESFRGYEIGRNPSELNPESVYQTWLDFVLGGV